VHCHNDLGMAVANSLTAVMNGARQWSGTVNGLGERAATPRSREIVMAVRTRQDYFPCDTGIDTTQIVACQQAGVGHHRLSGATEQGDRGGQCFAHESGIHQDGVIKSARPTRSCGRRTWAGARTSWSWQALRAQRLQAASERAGHRAGERGGLNAAFARFKDLADKKSEIFDEDLQMLVSDEAVTRNRSTSSCCP